MNKYSLYILSSILSSILLLNACIKGDQGIPGKQGKTGVAGKDGVDGKNTSSDAGINTSNDAGSIFDAGQQVNCAERIYPPGFGGAIDSLVDLETAQKWLDFRAARAQERMNFAISPHTVINSYKLEHTEIDSHCTSIEKVIDIGRGLFIREFTLDEGYGNNLAEIDDSPAGANPAPNFRRFQQGDEDSGRFGGPDAVNCLSCHWKKGIGGGGDRADNSFLMGDGEDILLHEQRNPPALYGIGWLQLLAEEITAELKRLHDNAVAEVLESQTAQTLLLDVKGIHYGKIEIYLDQNGNIIEDKSGVEGIDQDLVVKPFGYKGVFVNIRDFAMESFQFHMNLQAEELLHNVETGKMWDVNLGNGPDVEDPDNDNVKRELSEGQISAVVAFFSTLETPIIQVPEQDDMAVLWQQGASRFEEIGCTYCHIPSLELKNTIYTTTTAISNTTLSFDLNEKAAKPHPEFDQNGVMRVFTFSDLKRHNMGSFLAGKYIEHGVPKTHYITRRLWGIASSGSFTHTGSAATWDEAIALHGGTGSEAKFASDAYFALSDASKAEVRIFLESLAKAPSVRIR